MAWDVEAKKLAIKAIATVESNLRYDAINYNDPITVGISQWYGTRAAHLLMQLRTTPAWVGVAASLTASLDANPYTDASYWNNRDLNGIEGTSLKPVLVSDTGVQVQNAQTIADLETYRVRAEKSGLIADTNTNAFIYWCMLYHQSPKYSLQILNAAGIAPTLVRLHTMALNHVWYRDFKTRLNTAKTIIESGDSTGIPDFGVELSPEYDGGDLSDAENPPLATGATPNDIRHVRAVGDAIHVVMADGRTVVCYPTGVASWIPNQTGDAPVIAPQTPETNPTTPQTPEGPTTDTEDALAAFLLDRVGDYFYSQGAGRDNPDVSGVTDCSALVNYAYRKVAGISIGVTTVDQQNYGRVIWRNTPGNTFGAVKNQIPDLSLLRKGDCVYFGWFSTFSRVNHVEMYLGDGRLIGHGVPGTYGPTIKSSATAYMDTAPWIVVRRYL